jgi:hypothetical protein
MPDERDNQEMSVEEEPCTQRFSVTVIWSAACDERVDPGEMQSVLADALAELDDDAVVEVTEINEPTY